MHPSPSPPGQNPYAPPAGDGRVPDGAAPARSGRGLRVAGGVVFLLAGIWSTAGGSCTVLTGRLAAETRQLVEDFDAVPVEGVEEADRKAAKKLVHRFVAQSSGLVICGSAILVAGLLCLAAGILLLLSRGRLFGMISAGFGTLAELVFFVLVAFNSVGVVKIAAYGFCGFCAAHGHGHGQGQGHGQGHGHGHGRGVEGS